MKALTSLAFACAIFFGSFSKTHAAEPNAAEIEKALGTDRGLVVLLGNDAWPLAEALGKSTELSLLIQAADGKAVAVPSGVLARHAVAPRMKIMARLARRCCWRRQVMLKGLEISDQVVQLLS